MKRGKFPAALLARLLAKVEINDERVLLDFGDRVLVAKTDPVTFATQFIGSYAVHVNANDVACTGATPRWFMATLLIPESFAEKDAEDIFDQILEACSSLDVTLVGGHSEVTRGLANPIIVGCMLGEVEKCNLVSTGGAKDGDSIVLTKGIALEGTSLLARDATEALVQAEVDAGTITRAK